MRPSSPLTTAGVVALILVGLGELLARLLHFSTGSLSIAGGIILVIIAIPSFKLMFYMDKTQSAEMTVKVTGHQWYWSYEYPDYDNVGFDSNLIPEDQLKPGQKRLLGGP